MTDTPNNELADYELADQAAQNVERGRLVQRLADAIGTNQGSQLDWVLEALSFLVRHQPVPAELTTETFETTVTTVDGTAPADAVAIREQIRRWYLRNGTFTTPTVDQLTDDALEAVAAAGIYYREVARLRRVEDALVAAGAPNRSEKGDPGGLMVAYLANQPEDPECIHVVLPNDEEAWVTTGTARSLAAQLLSAVARAEGADRGDS